MKLRGLKEDGTLDEPCEMGLITKHESYWRKVLTQEQFIVTRRKGTEAPFTGGLCHYHGDGTYLCGCCGLPLFFSQNKFDSGTGWPSFFGPAAAENVATHVDRSAGMVRTEILCARCDAHLGHVFEDGPPPTGQRYCLNSVSLSILPCDFFATSDKKDGPVEVATFAAGCFWGVQARLKKLPGVLSASSGYIGGSSRYPTYGEICSGDTGHAEAVQVRFLPSKISYDDLLNAFWKMHDPTTLNRQGPDTGTQYRSAVFCHTEAQLTQAEAAKAALDAKHVHRLPVVTEIVMAKPFYRAEEYHQDFLEKHSGATCA